MLARSAVGVVHKTFSPNKSIANNCFSPSSRGHRSLFLDPVHHRDSEKLGLYSSSALRRGAAPVRPALAVGCLSTPSVKLSQRHTDHASADAVSHRQPAVTTPCSPHYFARHPLHKLILSTSESREKQRHMLSHCSLRPASAKQPFRDSSSMQQSAIAESVLHNPEQPVKLQSPVVSEQVMPVDQPPMHECPNTSLTAPDHIEFLSYSGREQVAGSSYCNGCRLSSPSVYVPPEFYSDRRSQGGSVPAGNSLTATDAAFVPPATGANSFPCDRQMSISGCRQGVCMQPSLMHTGKQGLTDDDAFMLITRDDTRFLSCLHTPLRVGRRCNSPTDMASDGMKAFDATSATYPGMEVVKENCMGSPVISHGASTIRQTDCVEHMQGAGICPGQSPAESSEHMPDDEEAMSFTDSMGSSRDEHCTSPDIDFFENSEMDSSPAVDDALTISVGQPMAGSTLVISSHPLAINAQSIVSPELQNPENAISSSFHMKSEQIVFGGRSTACDDGCLETGAEVWKDSGNDTVSCCGSPKACLDSNDRMIDGRRILGNQYVVEKVVGEVCDHDGTCVMPNSHLQCTVDEVILFLLRVLMELS